MGLLGKLLKDSVGEGISKGISNAIGKATERVLAPSAERFAGKAADHLNAAAEAIDNCPSEASSEQADAFQKLENAARSYATNSIYDTVLRNYPKWTFSPVQNYTDNEEDDHVSVTITAALTDDLIEKYQSVLKTNGFTGDWQIMKKIINGKPHYVDFSFVQDSEIQYLIYK